MGRDTVQLEIAVTTISQEYLLEFTSEYGISEALHLELPSPEDRIMDFPEGQFDPCSKPTKVKTGTRPRAAHEVPLLTVTANRVIEIEDSTAATDSSGVPSTIERSPLDFSNENPLQQSTGPEDQEAAAPEVPPPENVTTTGVAPEPGQAKGVAATESTCGGKSLAAIELGIRSTRPVPVSQGTPVDVSGPDPLSFTDPQLRPSADVTKSSKGAAVAGDPESENTSFTSMLRLRFKQKAKLLKKSIAQVARRDKRIQAGKNEIKNLETPLEVETDMKKATEDRSVELSKELENMRALFSDLQPCAKINARLDAQSIDFDEELYPHTLTVIAGRRWVIGHGLRLAMMKCGKLTELRQAFADVVSAGIVKDLKYPIVDQLEGLKDAPMDVIMASLHLKSDTGDDAPQWIRKLRLSSSQLTIPVYPKACDPTDPWACKE
uniref:Transposase (Putative), gypsy type n=1 Tax=Tanacetum cinerariifolium TaxID=118510 RepID=A0A6L2JP41_TANCI|nr:hypothetical protein [Tanacetum cinerariifolium]